MTKAYSYIRMSTLEQLKGDSARRQFESTQAYADKHGLEIQDIIDDIGVSAYQGANAKFGKLSIFLQGIQSGKIDAGSYLIVESLDRLSRNNVMSALGLLSEIVEAGIVVVTLTNGQTYTKESLQKDSIQLMYALTEMIRAHDESKIKSDRMSAAWAKKRSDIQSGKITKQRIPAWLVFNEGGSKFEILPERTELLNEIFQLCRDGFGAYSVARKLNGRNESTWGSSKIWHESYIKKLLNNRSVLGEFQPMRYLYDGEKRTKVRDGDLVPSYYPKVIEPNLFAEAQLAKSKRKLNGAGRKGGSNSNIFTGLLKCGICGSGYRYLNKGSRPKGGRYLQCSQSHVNGLCKAPAWKYSNIELAIISAIEQIDFDAIMSDTSNVSHLAELRSQELEITNQISSVESEINNYISFVAEGSFSSPTLADTLNTAENRKVELKNQLAKLQQSIAESENMRPEKIEKAKTDVLKLLRSDDFETGNEALKRKLYAELRLVVSEISIQPADIDIAKLVSDKPEWFSSFNMPYSEFEKKAGAYAFQLHLHYLNGNILSFTPIGGEKLKIDQDRQLKIFVAKQALPSS